MDNNLYNLLLRSLETPLAESEQAQLENAFASSKEFQSTKDELVSLRNGLQQIKGETFKPFFAERVMERLSAPQVSVAELFCIDLSRSRNRRRDPRHDLQRIQHQPREYLHR